MHPKLNKYKILTCAKDKSVDNSVNPIQGLWEIIDVVSKVQFPVEIPGSNQEPGPIDEIK